MVPGAVVVKVPALLMVMPPVPVAVQAAPRITFVPVRLIPAAPLVEIAPLKVVVSEPLVCVREAAVIAWVVTTAAEVMVIFPKDVVLPKLALSRMLPVPAAKLKLAFPLTVFCRIISPVPEPVSKPPPARSVIGLVKEMLLLLVLITPAKKTGPVPFCV